MGEVLRQHPVQGGEEIRRGAPRVVQADHRRDEIALFIIVLLVGISLLKPKKTEEDMIAEQDERNQYIELKCAEKAFRVALYASFMTIIAGMIAFGLTREYAFIWLVMGGIVPYGTSRIAYIVSAFRYDKP